MKKYKPLPKETDEKELIKKIKEKIIVKKDERRSKCQYQ